MRFITSYPPEWEHCHVDETASTMLDLQQPPYANATAPFLLLTADYQTAGRGQRGTHWEAARGENLLFGIRLHPHAVRPSRQFLLSEVQALAVAETLEEIVGGIRVKWPNDIYWLDTKICGMLLEHTLVGSQIDTTITGVGLNVNQVVFESDAPNPMSLRQITGSIFDREQLMRHIAWRFHRLYRRLLNGGEGTIIVPTSVASTAATAGATAFAMPTATLKRKSRRFCLTGASCSAMKNRNSALMPSRRCNI